MKINPIIFVKNNSAQCDSSKNKTSFNLTGTNPVTFKNKRKYLDRVITQTGKDLENGISYKIHDKLKGSDDDWEICRNTLIEAASLTIETPLLVLKNLLKEI